MENLEGYSDLMAKLDALETKVEKSVLRKALRAGAKVVAAAEEQEVPTQSGKLKAAIKVRAGKRKSGELSVVAGPGVKFFSGPTFYAGFIEYGHKVGSRKLGDKRKQVPANPFVKRAADRSLDEALKTVIDSIRASIDSIYQGKGNE